MISTNWIVLLAAIAFALVVGSIMLIVLIRRRPDLAGKAVASMSVSLANVWSAIKPTPTKTQKTIDLATKIFTGILSAPATLIIAEQVYGYVPAEYRIIVKIASVGVVEGLFFGSLWLLESKRNALSDSERVTNSLIIWGAYGLIVWVGWEHDGPEALIFRAAIAMYLFRITQSAFAYALRQRQKPSEKRPSFLTLWYASTLDQFVVLSQINADVRVRFKAIKAKRKAQEAALDSLDDDIKQVALDELRYDLITRSVQSNQPQLSAGSTATPPAPRTRRAPAAPKVRKTGTSNRSQSVDERYSLQELPDGDWVGRCPECSIEKMGTRRSVINQLNPHMQTHTRTVQSVNGSGAAAP